MERNELTLDIQNLEKTYKGNVEAVCGIDVKLEKQRIYALLGPNGAGKTTVLKSILGLIKYSGSILVLGRPVDEVREMISFVPEEKNLYENLNIEETLKLIRRISSRFGKRKPGAQVYPFHQLPCTKKIRTFSNGMKTAMYTSHWLFQPTQISTYWTNRHGARSNHARRHSRIHKRKGDCRKDCTVRPI